MRRHVRLGATSLLLLATTLRPSAADADCVELELYVTQDGSRHHLVGHPEPCLVPTPWGDPLVVTRQPGVPTPPGTPDGIGVRISVPRPPASGDQPSDGAERLS